MILTKTGWPLDTIAEWQRRSEEGRILAHFALGPVTKLLLSSLIPELASVGPPMLTRFRVAWGRRNDQLDLPPKFSSILSPGISSSTLTANPTTFSTSTPSQVPRAQDETNQEEEAVTDPFSEASPYPFFYIYETEQQALKEYDFRKGSKEVFSFPASPLSS